VLICPALEGVSEVPGTCHCYQKYHSKWIQFTCALCNR
jgi:hypothetical protein